MIETVGELLKQLHQFPSATKLTAKNVFGQKAEILGVTQLKKDGEFAVVGIGFFEGEQQQSDETKKQQRQTAPSGESEDALEQCDRILEMCEEVPEKGEDFADSIREKVESIADWISTNEHVTPVQQQSLNNMERGVSRWIDRD